MWKRRAQLSSDAYGHSKKIDLFNKEFLARYGQESLFDERKHDDALPSQRYLWHIINSDQAFHKYGPSWVERPFSQTHAYLHRPLVEFVGGIPREQLCQPGRLRDLMRRAFTGLIPSAIRERKTKALDGAARGHGLLDIASTLIANRDGMYVERQGYVVPETLKDVLRSPQSTAYNRHEVYMALALEVWLRNRIGPNKLALAPSQNAPRAHNCGGTMAVARTAAQFAS
jgi:hypothetical protein